MVSPSYVDPSTVEWCEKCRCKTWHLVDAATGERACEWHRDVPPETEPAPQQTPPEVQS
jgi:hypothetical protein